MGAFGNGKTVARPEETLSGIDLFKDLPPDQLAALVNGCQWRRYAANQEIVGRQDPTLLTRPGLA